eukprot:TRINITY_DN6462_c0_g1_i2.p1 TRINITY_DN6462_c0_g1~~TRINITY_DN6462_c0_g1_i2.p1  ORF type:complete len:358 (-),score=74.92 TRINITY_DN6462_c0_g1_i2:84-1157(-)
MDRLDSDSDEEDVYASPEAIYDVDGHSAGLPGAAEDNPGSWTPLVWFCWICVGLTILVPSGLVFLSHLLNDDIIHGIVRGAQIIGLLTLSVVVPGCISLYFIWYRNNSEKTNWTDVVKYTLSGALVAVIIEIVEAFFMVVYLGILQAITGVKAHDGLDDWEEHPMYHKTGSKFYTVVYLGIINFILAFMVAAFVEETFKYFIAKSVNIDVHRDYAYSIVILTSAAALGFALVETYILAIVIMDEEGFLIAMIATGFLIVFLVSMQVITAVLIGADVSERKFEVRNKSFIQIIWLPILLHGLFKFSIRMVDPIEQYLGAPSIAVISIPAFVVVCGGLYARKRAREVSLIEEQRGVQLE